MKGRILRLGAVVITAAGTLAGLSLVAGGAAAQEQASTPLYHGTITNLLHGLCLDATLPATQGYLVQVYTCNSGSNQQWAYYSDGTIRNDTNGLCLDAILPATQGDDVQVYTCNGRSNQQWSVNNLGGTGTITNGAHGLCLDATLPATQGSIVQVYSCNDRFNQQWTT